MPQFKAALNTGTCQPDFERPSQRPRQHHWVLVHNNRQARSNTILYSRAHNCLSQPSSPTRSFCAGFLTSRGPSGNSNSYTHANLISSCCWCCCNGCNSSGCLALGRGCFFAAVAAAWRCCPAAYGTCLHVMLLGWAVLQASHQVRSGGDRREVSWPCTGCYTSLGQHAHLLTGLICQAEQHSMTRPCTTGRSRTHWGLSCATSTPAGLQTHLSPKVDDLQVYVTPDEGSTAGSTAEAGQKQGAVDVQVCHRQFPLPSLSQALCNPRDPGKLSATCRYSCVDHAS
jgi:hypothetical protein